MKEPLLLHKIHCKGCGEYKNHGGEWIRPGTERVALRTRDEGFDSPPPPSTHIHTVECNDC